MRNAGLEEAQAGIKTVRRNISNLRYADDTNLMAESKEKLRASWWRWKRRVKKWLKTQHSKNKDHGIWSHQFSSVQSLSWVFVTPWMAAHHDPLYITNSWSMLKLKSTESVMPSNHLILCRPILLLPSIFPSIRVFSNELVLCIRYPRYWSFSFSISPSNEHSGLISFKTDWLDLIAVQGALKSLLQHHSSKASIL